MPNAQDYTVGWICAISTEYVAARAFLDEEHARPEYVSPHDNNDYTLGAIGQHNVVIAILPNGEYGISSAASVARDMLHSFPHVRIGLMVGIGGGAPSQKHDIRLGDIVISAPRGGTSGVFQYDFGKTIQDQSFRPTGVLNQPPAVLRTAMTGLEAKYESNGHQLEETINEVLKKKLKLRRKYSRPDPSSDRLYRSDVIHPVDDATSCAVVCNGDPSALILRPERTEDEDNPAIHYGLIASANQLMKDAVIRDRLAAEKDVLCFEMEAAGLMNHFSCLVIRGICDYSDSHKNKDWQGYAAMAAAAYAKDLLCRIAKTRVEAEKTICDILAFVENIAQDTNTQVEKLTRRGDYEDRQLIADWLTPVDYAPQQSDFIARRQEGTGEWLLQSKEFREWLKKGNQTLFCPGIPGAGKTIITSCHPSSPRHIPARPYYRHCLRLLLLKQFVQEQPSVPESVRNLYEKHSQKRTRPSPGEIQEVLHSVVSSYSRVIIIIDALDECQDSSEGRKLFLANVLDLQAKTGLNLFTTSRFIQEIENYFEESIKVEIRANSTDVEEFVESKLQNFRSLVLKHRPLQEEIKSRIVKAVDGMLLLAQLHVDSLAYKTTPKAIRKALNDLEIESDAPNDEKKSKVLDRAYMHAMERINGQAAELQELARHVISWITCAERPLTSSELRHALAVEVDESELDPQNIPEIIDMVSVCAGLVVVDEERDIIRLVHYITQEYFDRTWRSWFPSAHADITTRCVAYLSFDVFSIGPCSTYGELNDRLKSHVLYSYAAKNWGKHARKVSTQQVNPQIVNLLEAENKASAFSQVLLPIIALYRPGRNGRKTGLHLASYFGLDIYVKALLETRHHNPNSEDDEGRTPLHIAVKEGHGAAAQILLEKGADPNTQDNEDRTPLHLAIEAGHEAVAVMLVEKGADPGIRDHQCETPLHLAIRYGYKTMV